jgi:transcriptional regulator with XRE-family HTH domain
MSQAHVHTIGSIGEHIRAWRLRRRRSQLDLACDAEISCRHLSFIETGRSLPSRAMILRLAEELEVPPRERNVLLTAAGFAPIFPEHALSDAALARAREAIDHIIASQAPYPAFALDRHWRIVASNSALPELYEGVAARLLAPPVNAMRLSLHPEGLAPRILNYAEWRDHLLMRLRRQVELTADPEVIALLDEVSAYPRPASSKAVRLAPDPLAVAVPLRLASRLGELSFVSTTTVFGTPIDITLSELMLELFFPGDSETARIVGEAARHSTSRADTLS